jgi:hypothetical protein
LRYYAVRPDDGGTGERTLFVGYVNDFPTESDAWREVDRQRLTEKINDPTLRGGRLAFRQIAQHYVENDLSNPDVIKPRPRVHPGQNGRSNLSPSRPLKDWNCPLPASTAFQVGQVLRDGNRARLRLIFGRDGKLFLHLQDFLRCMFPEETLHIRREFEQKIANRIRAQGTPKAIYGSSEVSVMSWVVGVL